MIGLLETRSGDQRPVSQSSRLIGGVTGPHKSNFKVKALVKAQVNARLMRASSQGSRSKGAGRQCCGADRQLTRRFGM